MRCKCCDKILRDIDYNFDKLGELCVKCLSSVYQDLEEMKVMEEIKKIHKIVKKS